MKNTQYFPHDYHARKDPKCSALINDFGIGGYGTYWCLIEIMYEQGGKIKKFPALISGLAFELKMPEDELRKQIEAMLHQYELLLEDASHIWSNSVLQRLNLREAKQSKKSEAGKIGGIKSGLSRRTKAKQSTASEEMKQNEANEANKRKVKEIKEKEREKEEKEERNGDGRTREIFRQFRNVVGKSYTDDFLDFQTKMFLNKYPEIIANQAGGLVNGWAARITTQDFLQWQKSNEKTVVDESKFVTLTHPELNEW